MRTAKTLITLFLVTLFLYVTAFTLIEYRRVKNGPWMITFTTTTNTPALVIHQPKLGITNVTLTFPGGAVGPQTPQTITFADAHEVPFAVPFGQCEFLDTISLPGNVTLKIFGHQIQLLPRVLTIDGQEKPWQSGTVIPLPALP